MGNKCDIAGRGREARVSVGEMLPGSVISNKRGRLKLKLFLQFLKVKANLLGAAMTLMKTVIFIASICL